MSFPMKFSTILLAVVIVSGCQMPSLLGEPNLKSENNASATAGPDLTKLVSEEIVIAAAMPITKDGEDDLIERTDDPLPLTLEETTPDDLWERIRQGFALEHHVDRQRVLSELNWFIRHPDYLDRVATRATRARGVYQNINNAPSGASAGTSADTGVNFAFFSRN